MSPAPFAPDPGDGLLPDRSQDIGSDEELLKHYDVLRLRAPNPGPLTLSGTNTGWWGAARPGSSTPARLIGHLERLFAAIESRGGLGGVVLTHDHRDHAEAVRALLARHPRRWRAAVAKWTWGSPRGFASGPSTPMATSGHAPDHFALVADGACFTGDAVLGDGACSSSPHRGAMSGYLLALTRLRLREDFNVLCPGHGPTVWDAQGKLEEYVAHRIDRENA